MKRSVKLQTPLIALIVVTVLGLGMKLFRLSTPEKFVFDETYHAYTAQKMLRLDPSAYDPWAKNEKGVANEWTHPPLGKLLIAATMGLTTQKAFGSRLFSVLSMTLAFFLLSLLVWRSVSPSAGVLTLVLLNVETLLFTTSRIAMLEAGFIAILVALFFVYTCASKSKPIETALSSALLLGLGLATKWTSLFLLAGVLCLFWIDPFWRKTPLKKKLLASALFVVVPPVLYLGSYLHYFALGYSWNDFLQLQSQMWHYHTRLKATHDYSSSPLQWIFNLRPVWMWVERTSTSVANIYAIGNSVIFLVGLWAAGSTFLRVWKKKATRLEGLSLLIYLSLWLPWVFSPRIMFLHHYAPAVPFLVLLLTLWLLRSSKHVLRTVVFLSIFWFLLFYPHISLLPMPKEFVEQVYFFLPSWK